ATSTITNLVMVNATSTNATTTGVHDFGAIRINSVHLTDLLGTGLTVSGTQLQTTLGTSVDLASAEVTGILPIANGGTNASSFPLNALIGYDGTRLIATGTPQLTIGNINATSTTATSTFAWGIETERILNVKSTSATSTFANGIRLTGGCFQLQSGSCAGSSGAVSSVSNADSTLTISPTTGDVVASLNLGNANTWTAQQTLNASLLVNNATSTITNLTMVNATSTNATTSILAVSGVLRYTGSATSTFGGGIQATALDVTSGTSTFANGIQLSAGCFRGSDGSCISAGGSITGSGSANLVARWTTASNISTGVLYDTGSFVGVATDTPSATFAVHGTAFISGTTTLSNIVATGTMTFIGGRDYEITTNVGNDNTLTIGTANGTDVGGFRKSATTTIKVGNSVDVATGVGNEARPLVLQGGRGGAGGSGGTGGAGGYGGSIQQTAGVGGLGGEGTITNGGTGGAGGGFTFTAGAGGAGGTAASGNSNGGAGGGFAFTLGSGGAPQGAGTTGSDGAFTIKAGSQGNVAKIFTLQNSSGSDLFFANATGGIFASSTAQITATTTLYNDLVFATTTRSQFIVVPTSSATNLGGIKFATTTTDGPGQNPLFFITSTTTGALDYARVGVGTTTQGVAGLLDQFYVAGRINSSWRYFYNEFFAGVADDTADDNGSGTLVQYDQMNLDVDGVCTLNGNATDANGAGVLTTGSTSGNGCSFGWYNGTGGHVPIFLNYNPVFETALRIDDLSTSNVYAGFSNFAEDATSGSSSTDTATFIQSDGGNWLAVTECVACGGTTSTDTGVAPVTTGFQILRIEAASSSVRFYINGRLVATNVANLTAQGMVLNFFRETTTTATRSLTIDYVKVWQDDPPGGPPLSSQKSSSFGEGDADQTAIISRYAIKNNEKFPVGTVLSYVHGTYTPGTRISSIETEPAISDSAQNLVGVVAEDKSVSLLVLGNGVVNTAILGRAPIRVSSSAGEIKAGDYLASSEMPGIAVKALRSGMVIGKALEDYAGSEDGKTILAEIDPQFALVGTSENESQGLSAGVLAAVNDFTAVFTQSAGKVMKYVFDSIVVKVAAIQKLFTRELVITPDGTITVPSGANQMSGSGMIPAGSDTVTIDNALVTSDAKIFVTPTIGTDASLAVVGKSAGQSFTVRIVSPVSYDIPFDWLIFQTYQAGGDSSQSSGSSGNNDPPPPPPPPDGGGSGEGEPPQNPPSVPIDVSAEAKSSSEITITWSDISSDENLFMIQRSTNGLDYLVIGSVEKNITVFNDNGLEPDTTYYYRLFTTNVAGDSPYSDPANATTLITPPSQTEDTAEFCADTLDNDSDGLIDLADSDCASFIPPEPPPPEPPPVEPPSQEPEEVLSETEPPAAPEE
ncbi:MAG: hypothetical protein AAB407_02210, partial [Patescibacteria group bacterium]